MALLTTLQTVRDHIPNAKGEDPDRDRDLERLIGVASAEFIGAVGWPVVAAGSIVETRDGDGGCSLLLRKAGPLGGRPTPPLAVSALTVDGTAILARALVGGDGYVLDPDLGQLELVGSTFAEGVRNVVVTLSFGYAEAAVPKDIEQAVLEAVLLAFQRRTMGGAAYVVVEGTVVDTRGNSPMFAHAQGIIEAYRLVSGVG